jgi:hypothetical protein
MSTDPAHLSDRSKTVDRSELKMQSSDEVELSEKADVDEELIEEFDL